MMMFPQEKLPAYALQRVQGLMRTKDTVDQADIDEILFEWELAFQEMRAEKLTRWNWRWPEDGLLPDGTDPVPDAQADRFMLKSTDVIAYRPTDKPEWINVGYRSEIVEDDFVFHWQKHEWIPAEIFTAVSYILGGRLAALYGSETNPAIAASGVRSMQAYCQLDVRNRKKWADEREKNKRLEPRPVVDY